MKDLKGGVGSNNRSRNTMLMDISHIIISSKYILNKNRSSKGKWRIYSLDDKKWKDITEKIGID